MLKYHRPIIYWSLTIMAITVLGILVLGSL